MRDATSVADAQLRAIISIAADAIISIDAAQRIVLFNTGAERIFGYAARDVLGQPLAILLPEGIRDRHAQHISDFSHSASEARRLGERSVISGRRRNGEVFPAEASISKLRAGDEWVFTVILRDATERKRSEDDLKFLAAATKELSRSLDLDDTLKRAAQAAVPALADACTVELFDSDGALARRAAAGTAIAERDDGRLTLDLPLRQEARGEMTLLLTSPGRRFDERTTVLARELATRVAFVIDNAELYHRSQQAVAVRDEVVAIVSHDLRNPLSVIKMCASTLAESPDADPATVGELARTAHQSAEWMLTIIQDLLDVARLESGTLEMRRERVSLAPVVAQCLELHAPLAAERGVRLDVAMGVGLPELDVDVARIGQVLSNLVGNALKFTEAGGTIRIGTEQAGPRVRVSVADTGRGIGPDELRRLFDRLWQARRSDLKRGTGLGLAIAKGIVEAHGGTIRAESVEGSGSTFSFELPLP